MFGIKSRKRIKELETEVNNLKVYWELSEELHGTSSYLKELTRNELIKKIIELELQNDEIRKDVAKLVMGMDDQSKLKKENSDLKAEIETLKSKLSRKKK